MRAYQFISEKAVSKKQQQFFGIVRAMQKGDMPKSGEAGEVAKDMKKSDVKDFAKTKHKGLPTKKKTSEEAAGVGIVTKQNATADVPVGGEYMNVKKLFPKKKKKKESIAYEDMKAELNPKSQIYVDMDGVLADFFKRWEEITGKNWRQIKGADLEPALQKIRDTKDFWIDLPMTSNARSLLSTIKKVKGEYKILSAPLAGDPDAEPGKRAWIEKNLDFFPPSEVIITKDKAKYATNPDGTPNILIDDYGVNIDKWESAGGIGFKHKDYKLYRTIKKLEVEEAFQHLMREYIAEGWSEKYKKSINCSNPKGFSQKAHCAGRKKKTNEGDIGLYQGALRGTVIDLISDKIQQTDDIEKLAYWLRMIVGKTIEPRAKGRYTITDEDVLAAIEQSALVEGGLAKKIGAGALAAMIGLSPVSKAMGQDANTSPLPDKQTTTMVQKDAGKQQDVSKIKASDVVDNKLVIVMDNGKEFDLTDFEGKTAKEKWINFGKVIEKVYSKHDTKVPNYELKRGDKTIARSTSIGNIYR